MSRSSFGFMRVPTLIALFALGLAACAKEPPRSMAPVDQWGAYITEASQRFDVPEPWIRAVMAVESGGRTHWGDGRPIESHAGAMGLMQVMPGTWRELAARYGFGNDPHDPRENILAGTAYIREMYEMYGSPGFLGAYNAGPGRYRQFVENGRTLPGETRRYMEIISPQIAGIHPRGSGSPLMDQYAERQVRERVVTPAPARMDPIPDGSTVVAARPAAPAVTTMSPIVSAADQTQFAEYGSATAGLPGTGLPQPPAVASPAALPPPPPVAVVAPQPAIPPADTDAILSAMASAAPPPAPAPAPAPAALPAAAPAPVPAIVPPPPAAPADGFARSDSGLPAGWFVPTAPVLP